MKYIDAEKLKRFVESIGLTPQKSADYNDGRDDVKMIVLDFIDSLQQEQPDYKEAVQLVFEEELIPFKDGNQWCFLLGRNIQEGVCGFGDTILDAAIDFYKDYSTTKIHIGDLKKTMEQPEVDLEKEYQTWWNSISGKINVEHIMEWYMHETARHFYELGLNAREK